MSAAVNAPPPFSPLSSNILFIQLEPPPPCGPSLDLIAEQLKPYARFKFHEQRQNDGDSIGDSDNSNATNTNIQPAHFHKVEFDLSENARKAYAVIQNIKLKSKKHHQQQHPQQQQQGPDIIEAPTAPQTQHHQLHATVRLSLSINEDASKDPSPSNTSSAEDARSILNVSELPPSCNHAGALYDHFIEFGPIYRVTTGPHKGTAQVIYYTREDADKAEQEMHFSTIDDFQIIVRRPSKYDAKDSFKNPAKNNPSLLPVHSPPGLGSSSNYGRLGVSSSSPGGTGRAGFLPYHQQYHQWGPGSVSVTVGAVAGGRRVMSDTGPEGSVPRSNHIDSTNPPFSAAAQPFEPSSSAIPGIAASPSQGSSGIKGERDLTSPTRTTTVTTLGGASSSRYASTGSGSGSGSMGSRFANASPAAPFMVRSISQPIKLSDPTRLIMQNVPLDLRASSLFKALHDFIPSHEAKLLEASLALDSTTGKSSGIAVLRYETQAQAVLALRRLNDVYLPGYGEEMMKEVMPLRVKLFEPKGYVEKGLNLNDKSTSTGICTDQVPTATVPEKGQREASFASTAAASGDPIATHATSPPSHSPSNSISNVNTKHRKLLSTALDDLPPQDAKQIFTIAKEKNGLLDLLLEKLPEEERRRCILEEKYLIKRCMALKELYLDGGEMDLPSKTAESPTARVYERKELLELYSPHSPTHPKTEAMIRSLSQEAQGGGTTGNGSGDATAHGNVDKDLPAIVASPVPAPGGSSTAAGPSTFATQQALPSSDANPWSDGAAGGGSGSNSEQTKNMTMEALVRFSVKAIIDLATGQTPPPALENRNPEITRSVDAFMDSISSLRSSQQKQKIGEKVFKVFKARAPGMKNISKRTVTLLDQEDLRALMHLTEEFPDVLVAKAVAMEV